LFARDCTVHSLLTMCEICERRTIRSTSPENKDHKKLGQVGVLRRRVIHNNRSSGDTRQVKSGLSSHILDREWQSIENIKQGGEKKLRKSLVGLFSKQVQLLLKRLREKVGVKGLNRARKKPEVTPLIVDTLLDWSTWFQLTKDATRPGVESISEDGFQAALERVGTSGPNFSASRPEVRDVIENIVSQAAGTQNTFQQIASNTIQRGLEDGDDMDELVRRVASKTEEQVGFRLDRIVKTAGQGGFEIGQKNGFRQIGIEELRWLTQRDPRVRSPSVGDKWDHRGADGQVVSIDSGFLIAGEGGRSETLRFPGDPQGSAGNVIYCRCTQRPVR